MASNDDSRSTDNKASIALLRRVRAGDHVHFVHHVDVCDAVPEVLVADLEPVPGTGVEDDGYSRIWYFYHAKKFTNTRGKLSGHRQRAVTGGDGTSWHSEIGRKDVEGSGGGTFCTFSYGRKTEPSARSIDRMGWCMAEYDFVAADKKQDEAADDSSNYVLCKVYRSPRAKGKSAPVSASSSKNASSKTAKKRKAGGDHPEAPPAKSIQQQEPQVHQETAYCYQPEDVQEVGVQQAAGPGAESEHWHGGVNFNIEDFNVDEYTDILEMLQDEPKPDPEPEHDGRFIELPCGPVLAAEVTAGDTTTYGHCSSYAPSWLYTSATGCSSELLQVQGHDPLQAPAFLSHVLTGAQGIGYYY
ncbi:unnamed protein product [Miscanthus lutarioriparius]|uniref:NAC domain-containing protein n=1 Tax=Miscanthus lutarioriparius TaxID=422564 RepID=A0A811MML0_9POAL|nr:unnamed protein product [Miscanthus lutarioriparius]